MITLAVVTLVSAAMFAAVIFMSKSSFALGNHVDMTGQIRYCLDNLSRDVHSAVELNGTPTDTKLSLRVQRKSGTTLATTEEEVTYTIDNANGTLSREVKGEATRILVRTLESGKFVYFDSLDRSNPNFLDIKKLDLQLATVATDGPVTGQSQTIRSARFVLRNRPVR